MTYNHLKSQVIENGAPLTLAIANYNAAKQAFLEADSRVDVANAICALIVTHCQWDMAQAKTTEENDAFYGKMKGAAEELDIWLPKAFELYCSGRCLRKEAPKWML